MGIFIRQGIKGSVASYIGAVIGYFNVVFITPYCLPPEIVGLNRVLVDMGIYLAFLAQLGILPGIIRFYPKFKDKENQLLFLSFIVPLIGFILFGILFLLTRGTIMSYFAKNSSLINSYITLVLPLTFFIVYLGVLEVYSSCLLRIVVPKIIREVILKTLNIIIIVLFYFKYINLYQFLWCIIIIYAVAVLLNLFYLSFLIKFKSTANIFNFDYTVLKDFSTYVLLILLLGIGSNIVSKIDVFMISSYINLTNTGIYSIAVYIIVIIEIPARSFQQLAGPVVAKSFHEGDHNKIKEIYSKSSLIQFLIGGIIFLMIWINIDRIFSIMPNGAIYQSGKYVILFMGFSKLFDMLTGVNSIILSNSKNYASLLVFILYLTVITIVTNYFLIPKYGITGAAIASLIALSSYNIILIVYLWYKMKIQPFSKSTLIIIFILLGLYLLNFAIPILVKPWIDIIYRSGILTAIFLVLVYKLKISTEINDLIKIVMGFIGIRIKN